MHFLGEVEHLPVDGGSLLNAHYVVQNSAILSLKKLEILAFSLAHFFAAMNDNTSVTSPPDPCKPKC